jgi:hypothetical protein
MKAKTETGKYAQMGMAALLPGMIHMQQLVQEFMQGEVENIRARLAALQEGEAGQVSEPKRRGRPPLVKGPQSGWPADPEARKREMKRRQKVAERKRKRAALANLENAA